MLKLVKIVVIVLMLCAPITYAQDDWQLQIIGGTITTGQAQAVANSGIYAYVADSENGLIILDLSNPTLPTNIGGYNSGGIVGDLIIDGSYVYLAHWARGMTVLDITAPTDPELISTFNTPGSAIDLFKSGDNMYIADFFNGLVILDISNPDSITQTGYSSQIGAISVAARDSIVYLGSQSMGLITYTVGDTIGPVVSDFDEISTDCNDIVFYENFLLLACGQAGMLIYDISNPQQPDSLTSVNTLGSTSRIAVKDTIAYLADSENGVVAVNISDPRNPQLIQIVDTPSSASGIAFYSDFTLVADGWMLLVLYHDEYSDIDEPDRAVPGNVKLHECYPNPFNPSTNVNFELKTPSNVKIDIYDIQGRLVEKLVNGFYPAGNYAVKWNARDYPSGMYFIRLYNGELVTSAKALYLK